MARFDCIYTKTELVFGLPRNQILVAVIPGKNVFTLFSENHCMMGIKGGSNIFMIFKKYSRGSKIQ